MKKLLRMVMVVLLCATFVGCGGQQQKKDDSAAKLDSMKELKSFAVKTAESIEPKDTETPAEQGGYGFEAVAEELGYRTYTSTVEEQKFFGDPRATKGGVLTTITSRYPATMRTEGKNSQYVENSTMSSMIYETLLNTHPVTSEYMPGLASHWKISEDKMKYWFRINPDARFSDGKPVTSEDVIATWMLHMDETILSPSDQLVYSKYNKPVAESKYIVSVECKELSWRNFLYFSASTFIYPAHHLKGLSGTDYLKEYQDKFMPGTGPYIVLPEDIKNQLSYAVTRRLDYWGWDDPLNKYTYNFDKIKFIVVKDNPSLEYEKFKKGEQDFFTVNQARRWVEETNFDNVEKGFVLKRKIYSQKPAGTSGYALNMREEPFNDRRVRLAFAYLLNRQKLIDELFYNEYILQDSMYAGSVYENPNNEKIRYNPEKAMELLAEVGWKEKNSDGLLINDKGEPFIIEMAIPKVIDYIITPYQQMLREYGIDMQIQFMDGNALWKMEMDRNFKIIYTNRTGLVYPNPETSMHSSLADKKDNNNIYGFANKRVDELCDLYDVEFDQAKRIDIIQEIDGLFMHERPLIVTHYAPFTRILFWNKFGYPEYMVSRYIGDYRSIYSYWWFDRDKIKKFVEAQSKGETLPQGEVENKFWTDYLEKERAEKMKAKETEETPA